MMSRSCRRIRVSSNKSLRISRVDADLDCLEGADGPHIFSMKSAFHVVVLDDYYQKIWRE